MADHIQWVWYDCQVKMTETRKNLIIPGNAGYGNSVHGGGDDSNGYGGKGGHLGIKSVCRLGSIV